MAGYKFDADGITEVITRLENLIADRLHSARMNAEVLRQIQPPGDENMSKYFANEANASGAAYIAYLDATIEGLNSYVADLKKARERILAQEDATAQSLGRGRDD